MKKHFSKATKIIAVIIAAVLFLCSCNVNDGSNGTKISNTVENNSNKTPVPTENINTDSDFTAVMLQNKKGEYIFDVSAHSLIEAFNRNYEKRFHTLYFTELSSWVNYEEKTPFYEYNSYNYRFSADETVWSMPTLSFYMPENEKGIYEIKLTFDDHAYSETMYEEYKNMCVCVLSTLLKDFSDDEIKDIYNRLYDQTAENFYGEYYVENGEKKPAPKVIYYCNNIGMYAYYGAGTANICIFPFEAKEVQRLFESEIKFIDVKNS